MIIGERKPIDEIMDLIEGKEKIFVFGCGGCTTICLAGGEKEVAVLASLLRLSAGKKGNDLEVVEGVVERQCEKEWIGAAQFRETIETVDAVVSLGCGIGVQALAAMYPTTPIVPGLNTSFLGMPEEQGVWNEKCQACGNCVLGLTGGICPITRCSKSLLNGPCGGSQNGKCEIDPDIECAWQLIYDRLNALGELELLTNIQPPKDWRTARHGGPRKIVREDLRLEEETT